VSRAKNLSFESWPDGFWAKTVLATVVEAEIDRLERQAATLQPLHGLMLDVWIAGAWWSMVNRLVDHTGSETAQNPRQFEQPYRHTFSRSAASCMSASGPQYENRRK
jgi:hypothetical protein